MIKLIQVLGAENARVVEAKVAAKVGKLGFGVETVAAVVEQVLGEFAAVEQKGGRVRCRFHFAMAAARRAIAKIGKEAL